VDPAPQPAPVQPTVNGKPVNGKPAENGKAPAKGRLSELDVPNYRASSNPVEKCATCSFIVGTHCRLFDFDVNPEFVCDSWAATPISQGEQAAKTFPPGPSDGQRDLERNFQPQADQTPLP
jgi:hypothetical protein